MKLMKTKNIRYRLLLVLFIGLAVISPKALMAQYQPQFTQYMFNEMSINPAYTGARECLSATLMYRNQWTGIDGAPQTETFTIHSPIANQKMGIGLSIINDQITVMRNTGIYANYAYRMPLSKGKLSFGLSAGFLNHYENLSELNPGEANDPQFAANTPKLMLPNAGFGAFYYTPKFYAGLSIPKLILNTVAASDAKKVTNKASVKDWNLHLTAGYVASVREGFKLKPTILIRKTGGAPAEIDLSLNALFNDMLWFGVGYRTGDAASVVAGLQITKQLRFGYAYDYTLTTLKKFNSGSHEFNLSYDFSFDKSRIATPRFF